MKMTRQTEKIVAIALVALLSAAMIGALVLAAAGKAAVLAALVPVLGTALVALIKKK